MEHAGMSADDKKYQAEEDVRTLVRAEEIRKDKARLRRATTMAKKQLAALQGVTR